MNYYRRYVGDYLRDTMRLTPTDHGVYGLMLDYYYAEEKPLPLDLDEIHAICKAIKPDDRKSVDKVLRMYFTRQPDGYHNQRADKEIGTSQQARTNGKGHTGKATGSPTGPITGGPTGEETEEPTDEVTGKATGSPTKKGGGSGHPPTTNHQPPASSLQPPTTNQGQKREAVRSAGASRLPLGELPDEWRRYCESERPDLDPGKVFENFFDYWTAKPGKEGVKADWAATWRMWVRKEQGQPGKAAKGQGDDLLQRNLRAVGL